jgi:hypothetical protein
MRKATLQVALNAMSTARKHVASAARSIWVRRGTDLSLTKSGKLLDEALNHLKDPANPS